MSSKEKAEQLVDKFHIEIMDFNITDLVLEDTAIKLALIAVDEIIKSQPFDVYTMEQCKNVNDYWQEVKQEIEKL